MVSREGHDYRNYSSTSRPVLFVSVVPPTVVGSWSLIYRTQCGLVISRFPIFRQQRGCYTQHLDFSFLPGHLKLLLSQYFVSVLHPKALLKNMPWELRRHTRRQDNRVRQWPSTQMANLRSWRRF